MKRLLSLFGVLLLTLAANQAIAETRYVTDVLKLNLRSGASSQHRIINRIPSGTPLEILETDSNGEFALVRTPKGQEGWVLVGYLQPQPTARLRLREASEKLQKANDRLARLEEETRTLKEHNSRLEQENTSLQNNQSSTGEELAKIKKLAANTIEIDQRNRQLLEENSLQKNEVERLTSEVTRLRDKLEGNEFYMGTGAIILGILIGLVLPHMKRKPKSDEWV